MQIMTIMTTMTIIPIITIIAIKVITINNIKNIKNNKNNNNNNNNNIMILMRIISPTDVCRRGTTIATMTSTQRAGLRLGPIPAVRRDCPNLILSSQASVRLRWCQTASL